MEAISGLNTALSGRYVVDREIGAGGMATVYLARDLRHDRLVALKVLRPELGAVLGLERFLSEIKVTANLQHPNLLPLFDSGEASGLLFYVMPYVDGETLRARLEREKQLPVDEVVRIAVAIANALDYAHSHNVIHRDLKPENILLQAGQPVIADFGIALAVSNAGGSRITQTGLSLGTPQYMSPEQATGDRVVDGRSDIYSLAAVTYEMLTGEAPHTGSTAQAIIARLLTEKPRSIRSTRSAVPEHIEATLEHALEKLPADRFSTAREFADSLLGRSTPSTARTAALASAARGGWRARLRDPLVVGLAIGVVALGAYTAWRGRAPAAGGEALAPVRFAITLPDSVRLENGIPWPGAVSPDGSAFVFSASTGGAERAFWIRRTDQLEPRIIPGTQGGGQPIFSPDGQWIAYEAGSKLFKVRLDGSAPVAVTTASANNGADWSAKDVIVLGNEGKIHGLSTVSSAGGNLTPLTHPDTATGELDHLWPVVAPDGNTVVFAIWRGALVTSQLAVTRLDDGRVSPLDIKAIRPLAIVEGQLIYVQADGAVMAVPFDAGKRRVTGKPVPVHDPVPVASANNGNSGIFVGQGGALITAAGGTVSQLAWQPRSGAPVVITPERRDFSEPRLSPDGRLIAVTINDGANSAIWVYDLGTGTMSKLTSAERASSPAWLPGGRAVAYFALDGEGRPALFTQSVDGGSAPQRVGSVARTGTGPAVSPDGRTFLFSEIRSSSWDIMQVTVDGGKSSTVTPYLATPAFEANPQFSPDGRWVSLSSGESDRREVVVRSFPDPRVRVQVSVNGGTEPRWSRDGSRLIYRAGDRFISARVSGSAGFVVLGRDTLPAGPPLLLGSALTTNYDVSPDGSRLLVLISGRTLLQLVGVPNWATELRSRLSANSAK